MQIINNIQQGTSEWLQLRVGVFTATDGQTIATKGKGLETLIYEKASEIITGLSCEEGYTNSNIERGKELEEQARLIYEMENGVSVETVAFVFGDLEHTGCSPDGLVEIDGLAEFKCPNNKNFVVICLTGEYDKKYDWQCQYQMFITGRKWADLVFFNPNFKNPLKTFRIERDEKIQQTFKENIEYAVKKALEIVQKMGVK